MKYHTMKIQEPIHWRLSILAAVRRVKLQGLVEEILREGLAARPIREVPNMEISKNGRVSCRLIRTK